MTELQQDWTRIAQDLDEQGWAILPGLLNAAECAATATLYDWPDGFRSKGREEFAAAGAPELDLVFTVCDTAAGEVCPVWPGQPLTAHWGLPDPAAVEGSDEAKAKAFHDTAITLKRRIELMLALPLDRLDAMAIHREVKDIGKQ